MSDAHGLSGAYAVDALDDIERARFEKHLEECPDCRAEVASLREAASSLADATPLTPPASLRASVLAAASQVRPLPPIVPTTDASADRSTGRRTLRRQRWLLLASAAAILLVVAGSVVSWHPWRQDQAVVSVADQVLHAPDAKRVTVTLDGVKATVVRSVSLGRAVIVPEHMPAAPTGKVYELWLERDGVMEPAGLMSGDGPQELVGDAASATAAGITVEPAGGSQHPTTAPIAVFAFSEAT